MAYKVTFSDRSQLTVDSEQGKKLMQLQSSVTKPQYVNVAGNQYKLASITKVEVIADPPKTAPLLTSGMSRVHDKSIHREIYYLYKKELQKPEPRKWEEFRQKAYDYLYTQSSEWCDDRKGTCVCDKPKIPPTTERVKEVMEFMRS